MSRAFVKEHDSDYLEDVADRPVSDHPNDVTEAGLKQIEAAVEAAGQAYAKAQAAADRSREIEIPPARFGSGRDVTKGR